MTGKTTVTKEGTSGNQTATVDLSNLTRSSREALELVLERCIRCNTCKYSYGKCTPSCPSGEKFKWESYWASGRIFLTRGLLTGELELNSDILEPIFACSTCGACQDSCQAPHQNNIVEIIEALREYAVKNFKAPERQAMIATRTRKNFNPYNEPNSDNEVLKKEYGLPEKAEVVYFIGCTSNYRQKSIRDATLSVLKKLGVNFTLIDEHCCCSPLIRTGQVNEIHNFMEHNLEKIKETGARTVITSCAGCYKTFTKDFQRFGTELEVDIQHTIDYLLPLVKKTRMKKKAEKTVTYHDPCHLGHHLGWYDHPREMLGKIPGIKLVEMERNKERSWCCGAGGGVKIGYPDWAVEIAGERIEEAWSTGAEVLVSTCPFCKTNLTDASTALDRNLEVADLVEILNSVL